MRCSKMVLETLILKDGKGVIPLAKLWLEGFTYTETRPPKVNRQIGVIHHDLDLFISEIKVKLVWVLVDMLKTITLVQPKLIVNC